MMRVDVFPIMDWAARYIDCQNIDTIDRSGGNFIASEGEMFISPNGLVNAATMVGSEKVVELWHSKYDQKMQIKYLNHL